MAPNTKTPMSPMASPNLDDILLDIVAAIELSPRDRQVAENRYRRLKEHLERPQSPLAQYLNDGESHIYPQGSMAIGATIVDGTDDDRFDLDALVEMVVPTSWTPDDVLDTLYTALKDFPDAKEIVRCTRCVQIRFAFMHMDVTILDPTTGKGIDRAGEIFHSPDEGPSYPVPANPYGFSGWFRSTVEIGSETLPQAMSAKRMMNSIDRLAPSPFEVANAAEQDDIPAMIPPHLDSEQVLALKLLKRNLNLAYENRDIRRPPSIYLTKMAADVGLSPYGLFSQLLSLAQYIKSEMKKHQQAGLLPDERNPSYDPDRLNDRWPTEQKDMHILEQDMDYLISGLQAVQTADFREITKILADLFGEKISGHSVERYLDRAIKAGDTGGSGNYIRNVGIYVPSEAVIAPAVSKSVSTVPKNHFHCSEIKKEK